MLTIKAEIKKSEQRSDKTYNVKLRFTLNRKVKRISTTIFVTPKDLTKEFKIKQSSPFYKEVNELICDYQEKCATSPATLNAFKNLLILFSVWLFILLFFFSIFSVYYLFSLILLIITHIRL